MSQEWCHSREKAVGVVGQRSDGNGVQLPPVPGFRTDILSPRPPLSLFALGLPPSFSPQLSCKSSSTPSSTSCLADDWAFSSQDSKRKAGLCSFFFRFRHFQSPSPLLPFLPFVLPARFQFGKMAPTESAFMTWFRAEFLTPRRLLFNFLWYGTHLAVFGYGWYSQVWRPPSDNRIPILISIIRTASEPEARCS